MTKRQIIAGFLIGLAIGIIGYSLFAIAVLDERGNVFLILAGVASALAAVFVAQTTRSDSEDENG
ncbi:MAG: hypothetical protein AAF216_12135 [Pseudomonadota bacterium]